MFSMTLESVADLTLSRYQFRSHARTFLGNAGGFSGARLWKLESPFKPLCLKAWPAKYSLDHLIRVHRWMRSARASGLAFVPEIQVATDGSSVQEVGGHCWDLIEWMPGRANFRERPSADRIAAACVALAKLHEGWCQIEIQLGPCPAIHRRLKALKDWDTLLASGWAPKFEFGESNDIGSLAKNAWVQLPTMLGKIPRLLEPYAGQKFILHPCICDIWHDHILFEEDSVSGIIDYGSMRIDSPAADLARLLGSLAGNDEPLFAPALTPTGRFEKSRHPIRC